MKKFLNFLPEYFQSADMIEKIAEIAEGCKTHKHDSGDK